MHFSPVCFFFFSIYTWLHRNGLRNRHHASGKPLKDTLQPKENLQDGFRPEDVLLIMVYAQLSSFPDEES